MGQKYSTGALPTPVDKLETYEQYLPMRERAAEELPETFDLRKRIGRVRNQGLQNSCVGEAGAVFMTYHRNPQAKDACSTTLMSPQFLYNCRANYPQSGMYVSDLERVMRTYGDCEERSYRYGFHYDRRQDISPNVMALAQKHKIATGYRITGNYNELKQALMENGPCMIVFHLYNHGSRFWHAKSANDASKGLHALAVVGWNKEGFILRNSWGKCWGSKGCTVFPYSDWYDIVELWTYQI